LFQIYVKSYKALDYLFTLYKPKILVTTLAVAISLVSFSLAYINLAFARTEQTEAFSAMLSVGA
jgi:hypothetical protein